MPLISSYYVKGGVTSSDAQRERKVQKENA